MSMVLINAQHGIAMIIPSLDGVCGASDLQPSCTTFGLIIFALAAAALCFITTIGMLLFRRRLPPLLKASGVLMMLALLSLLLPMVFIGIFLNKLAGAIVVLMVFPIFASLLFAGIVCFLIWGIRWVFGAISKRFLAHLSAPV